MSCIKSGVRRQLLISTNLYLGQILLGYTISWSGPIIPKLRNHEESPLPYLLSETQISLIASIIYIGCIPGPYITSWLSNYKGRKPCLILSGVVSVLGYLILSTSKDLAMLYTARILTGIGIGMIGVMNVVYIGEMASTNIRGILLTAVGMFTTSGAIILFSVGPFLSYYISCYIGLALSVLFTIAMTLIPESPLFYVLKDNETAVEEVLIKLRRIEDKNKLFESRKEFRSTNSKTDWLELFTLKTNRRALFIVLVINILQHCSGFMAVVLFSASIFDMAGSAIGSNISMIIISFFQLMGSAISPVLIERVGRRVLLLISTATCCLTMVISFYELILGVYFYLRHLEVEAINNVSWLPLVILILFFIGYDSGLGIIPNCLIGEMFTANVRSKGSAVALSSTWLAGFLVATGFGIIIENFGAHAAFWIFSSTSAFAFLFTLFYIPETKGKSLLEIQKLIAK